MTLDTTIPLWSILSIIIPLFLAAIGTLVKMWFKQNEHTSELTKLHTEQAEIKQLIREKNEATLHAFKLLDDRFRALELSNTEIKTLLGVIIKNRHLYDGKN